MINMHFVSSSDVFILAAAVWFETEINDNDALKRTGWVYDLSNFEYPIDPPSARHFFGTPHYHSSEYCLHINRAALCPGNINHIHIGLCLLGKI